MVSLSELESEKYTNTAYYKADDTFWLKNVFEAFAEGKVGLKELQLAMENGLRDTACLWQKKAYIQGKD